MSDTGTFAEDSAFTSNSSVAELLTVLLERAFEAAASDVHIDPTVESVRIRFRIDGVLQDIVALEQDRHASLISRIKVLSSLRTDEHQAAQDGRFRVFIRELPVDVRVAISPTYHGERAVLRLLAQTSIFTSMPALGMSEQDYAHMQSIITRPHGLVLVAGPTGSGKTTTLYALLHIVHSPKVSIVTIEDPVEYTMAGVNQIQVNSRSSITFASGLRSILRQDPNIIMVGEIRDAETAKLAVNSALTGHLIFSTIHTNDAATTLVRLLDLGIEGYLAASTVNVVIAQRLVRTICSSCAKNTMETTENFPAILRRVALNNSREGELLLRRGVGCEACMNTGYKGRTAIFEVLYITPAIRALILRKASASEIARTAVGEGMTTMMEDALLKIYKGLITPEEAVRVLQD